MNKQTKQAEQKIDQLGREIEQLKKYLKPANSTISSEKISLWFLVSRLKLSQLWGLIIILVSIISGSITLTYQLANKKSDAELLAENAKSEVIIASLKLEISKYSEIISEYQKRDKFLVGLEKKSKFFEEYLNYLIASKKCSSTGDYIEADSCKSLQKSKKIFKNRLKKLWEERHKITDGSTTGIIIGLNGEMNGANITFLYDGSIWQVPSEFVDIFVEK